MPAIRQSILCFGRDEMLLSTRQYLLVRASYISFCTTDFITAAKWLITENIDILVLCHTLTRGDVEDITRAHRETHSTATILRLRPDRWHFSVVDSGIGCEIEATPAAFLSAISALTDRLSHN